MLPVAIAQLDLVLDTELAILSVDLLKVIGSASLPGGVAETALAIQMLQLLAKVDAMTIALVASGAIHVQHQLFWKKAR